MKRAPRSLQHHVLYRKYNGQDSEISALLGKCGLTGHATLNLEGRMAHDGADGRYWTFDIEAWQLTPHRPEPAWKLGAYSRFNPPLET